jgi:hypothetical protein
MQGCEPLVLKLCLSITDVYIFKGLHYQNDIPKMTVKYKFSLRSQLIIKYQIEDMWDNGSQAPNFNTIPGEW